MAHMVPGDEKKWPGFTDYLRTVFPLVRGKPKVWAQFKRFFWPDYVIRPEGKSKVIVPAYELWLSPLKRIPFTPSDAVQYGSRPLVKIDYLQCGSYDGKGPPSFCAAHTPTGNLIVVNRVLAGLVEYAMGRRPAAPIEPQLPDLDAQVSALLQTPASAQAFARKVLEFTEGTLLHELIHVSHFCYGNTRYDSRGGYAGRIVRDFGKEELPSFLFEQEAYGHYIKLDLNLSLCPKTP